MTEKLHPPIKNLSPSGVRLWELLQTEFQVPSTSKRVVITLDVNDCVRIDVNYWPQQLPVQR